MIRLILCILGIAAYLTVGIVAARRTVTDPWEVSIRPWVAIPVVVGWAFAVVVVAVIGLLALALQIPNLLGRLILWRQTR